MAKEFRLPDPGEGIHEAEILEVYVSAGDEVQEDDLLLYVETDKAAIEIPSPFSGVIEEVRVKQGDVVEVGAVLVTYQEGAAKKTDETADKTQHKEAETADQAPDGKEGSAEEDTHQADDKQEEPDEQTEQDEQAEPDTQGTSQEDAGSVESRDRQPSPDRPVPAAPATRRLARELDVDLHEVSGSGPGGRVTAEDVRAFAEQSEKDGKDKKESPPKEPQEPVAAEEESEEESEEKPADKSQEETSQSEQSEHGRPLEIDVPELPDFSRWGPIEQEPLKSIRRVIAKRMSVAWAQIPHVTHQDVADITELEAFRQRHTEEIEQDGGSLSLTIFVLRALVATLKRFPRFNASLDPQAGQIILKRYYHIGVAVDTDRGLIVPVVRDVDRKSLVELSKELNQLVERVRNGKVKQDDVQGGTFTITNPGPLGGTAFTPIINYPEVAILGLARARLEPVVQGDLDRFRITPRLRLPIHLTFDHRVNDGADAARFVNMLIELLQEPDLFLLNV